MPLLITYSKCMKLDDQKLIVYGGQLFQLFL